MVVSLGSFDLQLTGSAGLGLAGVALACAVLFIWPLTRIIRRAGYSGWWVLAAFVPVVNVIMFWCFAVMKWPVHSELRQWRSLASRMEQARTAPVSSASIGY